jgi:deferrochelatase/peroxidase EfeB
MRRGIPYGEEVTKEEHDQQTTKKERGMIFVCYQSNIANGFRRVQERKQPTTQHLSQILVSVQV